MKQLKTAREVIEVLGGVDVVSVRTGRLPTTVYKWQSPEVNSFPSEFYVSMTADLGALGCTAPKSLWRQIELAPSDDIEECEEAADV